MDASILCIVLCPQTTPTASIPPKSLTTRGLSLTDLHRPRLGTTFVPSLAAPTADQDGGFCSQICTTRRRTAGILSPALPGEQEIPGEMSLLWVFPLAKPMWERGGPLLAHSHLGYGEGKVRCSVLFGISSQVSVC